MSRKIAYHMYFPNSYHHLMLASRITREVPSKFPGRKEPGTVSDFSLLKNYLKEIPKILDSQIYNLRDSNSLMEHMNSNS